MTEAQTELNEFSAEDLDVHGILEGTDKGTLIGDRIFCSWDYFRHYHENFKEFRKLPINVIELGVFDGGSLNVWLRYFGKAKIIGVDIDPRCAKFSRGRIQVEIGSQADPDFLKSLARAHPPTVVIDDGSHLAAHMITSFKALFPHVAPGGVYVIEDFTYQFSWDKELVLRPHHPVPPHPMSEPVYDFLSRMIQARLAHVSDVPEDDPHLLAIRHDDEEANGLFKEIDEIRIVGSMAIIRKKSVRNISRTLNAFDRRLDEIAQFGPEKYAHACFRYAHYRETYEEDLNRALALADEGLALAPGDVYGHRVRRQILKRLGRENEAMAVSEKLQLMGHSPDLPALHKPHHMHYPHR